MLHVGQLKVHLREPHQDALPGPLKFLPLVGEMLQKGEKVTFVLMAEQEFRQTARSLSAQGKGSLGYPQRLTQQAGGPLWGQEPGVWSWL